MVKAKGRASDSCTDPTSLPAHGGPAFSSRSALFQRSFMSLMRQQHVTLVPHPIKRFSRRLFGNLLHTAARAGSPVGEAKWLPPARRDEASRRPTSARRSRHRRRRGPTWAIRGPLGRPGRTHDGRSLRHNRRCLRQSIQAAMGIRSARIRASRPRSVGGKNKIAS